MIRDTAAPPDTPGTASTPTPAPSIHADDDSVGSLEADVRVCAQPSGLRGSQAVAPNRQPRPGASHEPAGARG